MKCLLYNKKLIFGFTCHITTPDFVSCFDVNYYQISGILSFAVLDLAYKTIKQRKRECIVLKQRKPIIYMLNYLDVLNFNSNKLSITFFLKNRYKPKLARSLYYYQNKHFKEHDSLVVIERKKSCIIRFDRFDKYATRLQPQNVNLVAMVIHILKKMCEKEKTDLINEVINASGIIFYCTLLS